jgi:excisionase family DNA binding protein
MTPREAADRLGISPRTLRRWVADGKCRPERLGTAWLFRRNDIDRLVRDRDVAERAHQKAAGGRGRS